MQMRNQGIPDDQIVGTLQQQGISPGEINDAFSQAQIKNAVAGEYTGQGEYAPQPQETYAPAQQYAQQEYSPQENYGAQQGGYGDQYAQAGGISTDTTIEIAEQVFSEKIKKTEKQLREITEFKSLAQTKIDNFENRLKRIENTIDKLQITILEKIGSYGRDIETTRKEMSMMQDSFGKVINPLIEKTSEKHEAHKSVSKKK
jgi:hypothetical protein